MSDDRPKTAPDLKAEKLAAALRANLRRRKSQARKSPASPVDEAEGEGRGDGQV